MKKLLILLLLLPAITFAQTPPLRVNQGGTGWGAVQAGGILYGGTSLRLATTTQGTPGYILSWYGGIPAWVATTTFSGALLWSAGNVTCLTASGSQAGCLSTSDWTTFNNKENVLTFTSPLIRNSDTITWSGLATTTALSSSNLLVSNGGAGVYGISTSSATVSSPLTGSFNCIGTGCTIGIQNASASQGGAITLNDYQRLYAATTTFSAPLVYTAATNAVTCTTATASVPGCLAAADFTVFSAKLSSSSIQSSLMLSTLLSDETGSGAAVFAVSPTFTGKITAAAASTTYLTASNYMSATYLTANRLIMTDLDKTFVSVATSTLYGTGTAGQVLMWSGVTGTPIWAATSSVAASSASSTLLVDNNTFSGSTRMGSTTSILYPMNPLQVTTNGNSYGQVVIQNLSSGTAASGDLVVGGDRMTNSVYYANLGCNSSGNTDATFSIARANDCYLFSQDGGLNIGTASSAAVTRIFAGGTLSTHESARFDAGARLMMGTTSPAWALMTLATSTKPQLVLSDGRSFIGWSMRSIDTNLFFATSTPTATSSIASLMMNGRTGLTTFPQGLLVQNGGLVSTASSTFSSSLWASLQMGIGTSTTNAIMGVGFNIATSTTLRGQLGHFIASTTDANTNVTINWNDGDTQRVIATTSKNIVINSTSSKPLDGGRYVLKLCQDATGGRAYTFTPTALRWGSGTTSIPTTANTCSMVGMIYDATYGIYNVVASSTGMKIN